jgi:hypothetical protein
MLMLHYDSNSAVASKAAAEGVAAVEVVVDEHSNSCWPYSQYLQTAKNDHYEPHWRAPASGELEGGGGGGGGGMLLVP